MKKVVLPICAIIFTFAATSFGQARFAGKVLDVLDGRTLVIDSNAGKIKAELQYIETPAAEQALHSVAREHLAKMAVGKIVEFQPVRILDGVTIGRVTMGGVDLSLQMIRDGAAWHEPVERSGQRPDEAQEYASNQESAKIEKRGVWSVAGLKTPWQIRAEKEEALRRAEAAKRAARPNVAGINQYQTMNRPGMAQAGNFSSPGKELDGWTNLFAGRGTEPYGLQTYTDPAGRFDAIYSSAVIIDLASGVKKQKVECRVVYYKLRLLDGRLEGWYAIFFRSIATDMYFSKRRSTLSVLADRKSVTIGRPYTGVTGDTYYGNHELFFYRTNKAAIKAVANARNAEIRIDTLSGPLPTEAHDLFKQLVSTIN